jgi:hypothetical protein
MVGIGHPSPVMLACLLVSPVAVLCTRRLLMPPLTYIDSLSAVMPSDIVCLLLKFEGVHMKLMIASLLSSPMSLFVHLLHHSRGHSCYCYLLTLIAVLVVIIRAVDWL